MNDVSFLACECFHDDSYGAIVKRRISRQVENCQSWEFLQLHPQRECIPT